jgi:hypothetical protein
MSGLFNKRLLAVLIISCAVAACDDEAPAAPTTPAPTVTDTFTGAITQNGARTHSFSTAASGQVTATLKSIGADNTLVVGFSLGSWDTVSNACSIVKANDAATAGAVLPGTMTGAGSLCVRVYDVGNIAAGTTATYIIEVVHP